MSSSPKPSSHRRSCFMERLPDNLQAITGPFYGSGLAQHEMEKLHLELDIPKKRREDDWRVLDTAWFDYRLSHPIKLTYLFAHEFREAWRREFIFHHGKAALARNYYPLSDRRLFGHKGAYSVAIAARQTADALGMPYRIFCDSAIRWLMRENNFHEWGREQHGVNQATPMPLPHHLNMPEASLAAQRAWENVTEAHDWFARQPYYTASNYSNLPWQQEHMGWLCLQARRRLNRMDRFLARMCYEHKVLTEVFVVRSFGIETVRSIRRFRD